MSKQKLVQWVSALLAVVAVSSVQATPTTWNFTGITEYNKGGSPGQSVSGSLRIDLATFTQQTPDSTYSYSQGQFYNPANCLACTPLQSNPLQVSGHYSDGSQKISLGGGNPYDYGQVAIYRNYDNLFLVHGYSAEPDNIHVIQIYIEDNLGAASPIFTDPDGGLDLTQGIHWAEEGATARFIAYIYDHLTGTYSVRQEGSLSTVSVSSAAVPEPATLALVYMALVGLAAVRRRNQYLR